LFYLYPSVNSDDETTAALCFGRISTVPAYGHFRLSLPLNRNLTAYHLICCLFEATKYRQAS